MSPDTTVPQFPNRPQKPMPKHRLEDPKIKAVWERLRLPAPKPAMPIFQNLYTPTAEDTKTARPVEALPPREKEHVPEIDERNYISRRHAEDADKDAESDGEKLAYGSRIYPRHTPDTTGPAYRFVEEKSEAARRPPQPPGSTASSVDDHDSFENTNNKKKRKIPTPGDSGMNGNGTQLSSDLASMGISSNPDDINSRVEGAYYSTSISTSSLSGPGRGRYGRIRNGRSPLRALSDTNNNWSNGRLSKQRQPQWPSHGESTGIISNAIANAEKIPVTPFSGDQENASLIQQQASKKSTYSGPFTFTLDSQVPGAATWPKPEHPSHAATNQSPAASRMHAQATQTSPGIGGGGAVPSKVGDSAFFYGPNEVGNDHEQSSKTNGPAAAATNGKKKRRRKPGYKLAAAQRRQRQAYQNYHHPPAPEDIWICEFCEYESIFGKPPMALMRQYEIKDREEKRKAEEKRRLLEKAKTKGRKGKKGRKNAAAKNTAATNPARQTQQPATQPPPAGQPQSRSQSQGTQSEEYYEDDYYDDDYIPTEGPPPLSPNSTPDTKEFEFLAKEPPIPGNFDASFASFASQQRTHISDLKANREEAERPSPFEAVAELEAKHEREEAELDRNGIDPSLIPTRTSSKGLSAGGTECQC